MSSPFLRNGHGTALDTERLVPIVQLREALAELQVRAESVLHADWSPREEIERVLTDASAQGLILAAERLRTKRRMVAAAFDASTDLYARVTAAHLARRHEEVTHAQRTVRGLIEMLRARVSPTCNPRGPDAV